MKLFGIIGLTPLVFTASARADTFAVDRTDDATVACDSGAFESPFTATVAVTAPPATTTTPPLTTPPPGNTNLPPDRTAPRLTVLAGVGAARAITLRPISKLHARTTLKGQLRVIASDAAGNRSTKTVAFIVK